VYKGYLEKAQALTEDQTDSDEEDAARFEFTGFTSTSCVKESAMQFTFQAT